MAGDFHSAGYLPERSALGERAFFSPGGKFPVIPDGGSRGRQANPLSIAPMKNRSILLATLLALLTAQPGRAQVPAQLNYQGRVTVSGVNFTGTGQFRFALVDGGVNQNQTATANATVGAGQVTQIFVFSHGSGYTSAPVVTITGDGAGATATATLGLGMGTGTGPTDSVNTITITNPGSGYTFATVTIAPPPPNIVNTTYWSNDGASIGGSAPASAVPLAVTNGLYSLALGDTALAHMTTALPASVFDNPDVRLRVWFDDGTHGSQLLAPDQRIAAVGYAMMASTVGDGAITRAKLANGAVDSTKLTNGAVGATQLAAGAISPLALYTGVTAPTAGQVLSLTVDGLRWVGDSIAPPVARTVSDPGALLYLANSGTGVGISALSEENDGLVGATHKAGKSGVVGFAGLSDNNAVAAINNAGTGLFAQTNGLTATAGFFWNTAGGDAIRADGNVIVHGSATVRVLTINNGIDVAEPFMIRDDAEFPRGSVMVISDDRPGELQLSSQPYDRRVAGIVSGANGINPGVQLTQKGFNDVGGQPVALTGRVYCRADASTGAIRPGDLLTTSANPGHAMKVNDHIRSQGAVLGKAMSALDEGTGFVLVLVTLQ